MLIDKHKIYELDNYKFVNFIMLDEDTIKKIRIWRNHPEIRKFMYNQDEITDEEHNNFIKELPNKKDKSYWLVYRNNTPLGVMNLIDYDDSDMSGELGYYMLPDFLESGFGLEFLSTIVYFLFAQIGIKRIFGRTEITNRNALIINYHLGFCFRPKTVLINDTIFIEQDLHSSDLFSRYPHINESKSLIKSIKSFNKIYKNYKIK